MSKDEFESALQQVLDAVVEVPPGVILAECSLTSLPLGAVLVGVYLDGLVVTLDTSSIIYDLTEIRTAKGGLF